MRKITQANAHHSGCQQFQFHKPETSKTHFAMKSVHPTVQISGCFYIGFQDGLLRYRPWDRRTRSRRRPSRHGHSSRSGRCRRA